MNEYTFKFKKEAKKCHNGTSFTQHKNLPTGGQVRFNIHETAKILFALSSEESKTHDLPKYVPIKNKLLLYVYRCISKSYCS